MVRVPDVRNQMDLVDKFYLISGCESPMLSHDKWARILFGISGAIKDLGWSLRAVSEEMSPSVSTERCPKYGFCPSHLAQPAVILANLLADYVAFCKEAEVEEKQHEVACS